MGDSEDQGTGVHSPLPELNEMGEAADLLAFLGREPKEVDEDSTKVGQKRPRDEGLTTKGEERMKKNPPETRVRPPKKFKDLFAPEKLREFRMPTAEAAARCEDIIMIWADRNENPAKRIAIKPDLFNYLPSMYTGDSKLLEGLKDVHTAEQMEEFLRSFCGGAPMRKPALAPKRAKKETEAPLETKSLLAKGKRLSRDRRAFIPAIQREESSGTTEEEEEAAPAASDPAHFEKNETAPLTVDTPWARALPPYARDTIAKSAHSSHLEPREMLCLMKVIKHAKGFLPWELPFMPRVGSLFCITASGPSLKDVDDGYQYSEAERRVEDFEDEGRLVVYHSNTSIQVNVQRRVYHIGGCDRYLVHYVKQLAWQPSGEVQSKAPPSLLKSAGAAAAVDLARPTEAEKKASQDFAVKTDVAELDALPLNIPASGASGRDGKHAPPSARLVAALGVGVLAPRVHLERCCTAVNAAFDDMEDPEPQLTIAQVRRGAVAAFNAPFSALSASHEKNWRTMVDEHPQSGVIYPVVSDVLEPLVAEGRAAAALEAAPTYDRMAMARALGVLANSRAGDNSALMDLVMYMQSGKAPMDWADSTFVLIRDAICQGEMDKALEWAERAMANLPVNAPSTYCR